jgi:hypothetical protein
VTRTHSLHSRRKILPVFIFGGAPQEFLAEHDSDTRRAPLRLPTHPPAFHRCGPKSPSRVRQHESVRLVCGGCVCARRLVPSFVSFIFMHTTSTSSHACCSRSPSTSCGHQQQQQPGWGRRTHAGYAHHHNERRRSSLPHAAMPSPSSSSSSPSSPPPRVFVLSDIHTDYSENLEWVDSLSSTEFQHDAVILAGDVSDAIDVLETTLRWGCTS